MSNILGDPVANPDSVIKGDKYRLTVLTPGLVRLEFSPDGTFEDRASTFAISRNLSKPECRFKHTESGGVELVTQRMRVSYDGKEFTPSGLHVVLIKKSEYIRKRLKVHMLMSRGWSGGHVGMAIRSDRSREPRWDS